MLTLMIVTALVTGTASPREQPPGNTRFHQSRFMIGFWVDPPLDDRAEERYREIAEADFTVVIGGFADYSKIALQEQLCEKYHLGLIALGPWIHDNAWLSQDKWDALPRGNVYWGYGIKDEPNASEFPELRRKVDAIRKYRPGKLAYINLFPNYACAGALGTKTYEEYVHRFVEEVRPDVLSMDHYPVFKPDHDGRDGYCANLAVMRAESLRADIPFWNFFNTMPYGPHTDPTEDQLRWQIFASLAYGAKGVMYFCYYTPRGGEFPKGGAIIAVDGHRTRHYEQAKRLNAILKALGPVLMQLTSVKVIRLRPDDDTKKLLKGSPIQDITRVEVDPPNDYLVGVFRHRDGRRAVLLMNYRFAFTAWPTVTFDAPLDQVREVSPKSGELIPVRDDSPDMKGIQLSLDAGEGRLFLLP